MQVNENKTDRIVRAVIGVALLAVGIFVGKGTWWGITLDVLGVVALFTAATGFCLLYKVFGNFSTVKKA